ncbi:MAG: methylglyoxal synthase [Chitinophagaceae bacterium]
MINNRKMNEVKRIAFVASDVNRKSLIEWSYYNQDILKEHELIATGPMAHILEGTIGKTVTKLHDGITAANHQLATLIGGQQIDILIFFWDPLQPLPYDNGIRALHDLAITNNIIIAGNLATADFILSSLLMNKEHSVPVQPEFTYAGKSRTFLANSDSRKAVLKLNAIN